jgi:hypothetical protein
MMGVRVYGSQPLHAAEKAKAARLAEITAELKALLAHLPPSPRGLLFRWSRYPLA